MQRLKAELNFVRGLMAVNLSSAMEYRASFLSQIVGMFINNGIYFAFWLIFFQQFGNEVGGINGYDIRTVILLFGIVALAFGFAFTLAGNTSTVLAHLIAHGRLDYYLVLPRNLLAHVVLSRMSVSAIGDIAFGLFACVVYIVTGPTSGWIIVWMMLAVVASSLVIAGFCILAGTLAFFIGNAEYMSAQMQSALLTFSLYPQTLFSQTVRLFLLTLLPAGFVGYLPVQLILEPSIGGAVQLYIGVAAVWAVTIGMFYWGLRRYESGSALNVNV